MNPKYFLIRFPMFCGISVDEYFDVEFYARKDPKIPDLKESETYEPFSPYEFKEGSRTKTAMRAVERWIDKNINIKKIFNDYDGCYWGNIPADEQDSYINYNMIPKKKKKKKKDKKK